MGTAPGLDVSRLMSCFLAHISFVWASARAKLETGTKPWQALTRFIYIVAQMCHSVKPCQLQYKNLDRGEGLMYCLSCYKTRVAFFPLSILIIIPSATTIKTGVPWPGFNMKRCKREFLENEHYDTRAELRLHVH